METGGLSKSGKKRFQNRLIGRMCGVIQPSKHWQSSITGTLMRNGP